jgi:hypothetical protein
MNDGHRVCRQTALVHSSYDIRGPACERTVLIRILGSGSDEGGAESATFDREPASILGHLSLEECASSKLRASGRRPFHLQLPDTRRAGSGIAIFLHFESRF